MDKQDELRSEKLQEAIVSSHTPLHNNNSDGRAIETMNFREILKKRYSESQTIIRHSDKQSVKKGFCD